MSETQSAEELREVAYDALREMYSKAEPSFGFDKALGNPEEMDERWYENHSLEPEEQQEIVEKHCDRHNLTDAERRSVFWEAVVNLGPSYGEHKS